MKWSNAAVIPASSTRGSVGSWRWGHEADAAALLARSWGDAGLWTSVVPVDPRLGPGRDHRPLSGASCWRALPLSTGVQRSGTFAQHQLRVHQGAGSDPEAAHDPARPQLCSEHPAGIWEGCDPHSRPESHPEADFRVWISVQVPRLDLSAQTDCRKLNYFFNVLKNYKNIKTASNVCKNIVICTSFRFECLSPFVPYETSRQVLKALIWIKIPRVYSLH